MGAAGGGQQPALLWVLVVEHCHGALQIPLCQPTAPRAVGGNPQQDVARFRSRAVAARRGATVHEQRLNRRGKRLDGPRRHAAHQAIEVFTGDWRGLGAFARGRRRRASSICRSRRSRNSVRGFFGSSAIAAAISFAA